jgi:hypothetical protein
MAVLLYVGYFMEKAQRSNLNNDLETSQNKAASLGNSHVCKLWGRPQK